MNPKDLLKVNGDMEDGDTVRLIDLAFEGDKDRGVQLGGRADTIRIVPGDEYEGPMIRLIMGRADGEAGAPMCLFENGNCQTADLGRDEVKALIMALAMALEATPDEES